MVIMSGKLTVLNMTTEKFYLPFTAMKWKLPILWDQGEENINSVSMLVG